MPLDAFGPPDPPPPVPAKPIGELTLELHSAAFDPDSGTVRLHAEARVAFADGTTSDGLGVGLFLNGTRIADMETDDWGGAIFELALPRDKFRPADNRIAARVKGFAREAAQLFALPNISLGSVVISACSAAWTTDPEKTTLQLAASATLADGSPAPSLPGLLTLNGQPFSDVRLDHTGRLSLLWTVVCQRLNEGNNEVRLSLKGYSQQATYRLTYPPPLGKVEISACSTAWANDPEKVNLQLVAHAALADATSVAWRPGSLTLNGQPLADVRLDGAGRLSFHQAVPVQRLSEGKNEVRLSLKGYSQQTAHQFNFPPPLRKLEISTCSAVWTTDPEKANLRLDAHATLADGSPAIWSPGSLKLNGQPLADVRLDEAGRLTFLQSVPVQLLNEGENEALLSFKGDRHQATYRFSPPLRPPAAGRPWTNSLGMRFVPVPGTSVLFSIWLTRMRDFAVFRTAANTAGSGDRPVHSVTWEDAQAFCAWLTREERAARALSAGQSYRLPTLSEWRKAKKGGSTLEDPNLGSSTPVGRYEANQFGLYDMAASLWEWTCDRCDDEIRLDNRVLDGKEHLLCGGNWGYAGHSRLLSSGNCAYTEDGGHQLIGFRCVLEVGTSR